MEWKTAKKTEMLKRISSKIGFDITDKEAWKSFTLSDDEAHKRDNTPSPLEKLSLKELLFLRENKILY